MDKVIEIAPVQGHTDAAWRNRHASAYGGGLRYYTPFIRCDQGELRSRDLRDFTSPLNDGIDTVPQVIFRDMDELDILLGKLADVGARKIDLNLGCPFPLQTGKGRGAALIGSGHAGELADTLGRHSFMEYTVKMRLGMEDPAEWRGIIDTLNSLPLTHITVHPRVARQQYGGELHMVEMKAFIEASKHPLLFNGDLRTPADISAAFEALPGIAGVMLGRGVLGRPSLAFEAASGEEWDRTRRIDRMISMHSSLLDHYSGVLQGEAQVLSKIKPFWEYAEDEIGRKAWKQIRKAGNMAKYHSAVAMIE